MVYGPYATKNVLRKKHRGNVRYVSRLSRRMNVPNYGNNYVNKQKYMIGLPNQTVTKLIYTDIRTLAPALTAYNYTWCLNSAYDLDVTGAGAQPSYYDQLLNNDMYSRYIVRGVKVSVEVINLAAKPLSYVQQATMELSTSLNGVYASQLPWSTPLKLMTADNSSNCKQVVNRYYDLRKVVGVGKDGYDANAYSGAYNANPSTLIYLHQYFDGYGANVNATVKTTFKLFVTLYQKYQVSGS